MDDELIGKRIKNLRKARGITQIALAQKAKISYSLLRKLESGERDVTQPVAAAVARALHVDAMTLTGQPYDREGPGRDPIHDLIPDMRAALAFWDLPPDLDAPPRATVNLVADAKRVNELCRLDQNTKMVGLLNGLIPETLVAFHESPNSHDRSILADALMALLHGARTAVYKAGYEDLTALAGERINWVATQTQDPRMKAYRVWNVFNVLTQRGSYGVGLRLMEQARTEIEDAAGRDDDLLRAMGSLHLRSAILAARAGKANDAMDYIAEAQQIATHLPEDMDNDWKNLSFGPANVAIHGVAAAVESQDAPRALALAESMHDLPDRMASWLPSRVGHHHLDLARAYFWQGEHGKALGSLVEARKASPQQTKLHPTTREVTGLLVRAHRRSNEPLARFAAWIGPSEEW
jgi:transcriptional regulator with XRE-family HTH domain